MRRWIGLAVAVVAIAGCGDGDPDPDAASPDAGADASGLDAAMDARPADAPGDVASAPDAGLVRDEGFAGVDASVGNPDRGLYAWEWDTSVDLLLVKPNLGDWCDGSPLPDSFLEGLRTQLDGHREAGRRVILRFVYADEEDKDLDAGVARNACDRADAESVDVIESHLEQLAPLLTDARDVVAFVEAGLLGMWGEWNIECAPDGTSLVTDADARRRVVMALLDAVPPDRPVLLRRPRFRQELEDVLSAAQLDRVGHHNDCLFASATDSNTYDGDRSPEEWKDYIAGFVDKAPTGGETCEDNATYTKCENALPELERLGYTYLHKNYNMAVLDRWRGECFEEIRQRLGYRVVLRAVEKPPQVSAGATLPVVVEHENVGFAPPYVTRRPSLWLRGSGGDVELATRPVSGGDTRTWQPGEVVRTRLEADVPADQPAGNYELRLLLRDDVSDQRAHAMLFANDAAVRDDARRENVLGTIRVE